MKKSILLIIALILTHPPLLAREEQKNFDKKNINKISINGDSLEVNVKTNKTSKIELLFHLKDSSQESNCKLGVKETDLEIEIHSPDDCIYTINLTIPENMNLSSKSNEGGYQLSGIYNALDFDVRIGGINASITTSHLKLHTTIGGINAQITPQSSAVNYDFYAMIGGLNLEFSGQKIDSGTLNIRSRIGGAEVKFSEGTEINPHTSSFGFFVKSNLKESDTSKFKAIASTWIGEIKFGY